MEKRNLNILIIEHDLIYGAFLKRKMNKLGKQIEVVNSAERGTFYLTDLRPELIFLDSQLPKINGEDIIPLFKEILPETKIVFMSSLFSTEEVAQAIQYGADYVFDKNSGHQLDIILDLIFRKKESKNVFHRLSKVWKSLLTFNNENEVVILEQDKHFASILSDDLKKGIENSKVTSFDNPFNCYTYCLMTRPELIFLDYHSPNFYIPDIVSVIRKLIPQSQIVILSSLDDKQVDFKFRQEGIENYILKDENWREDLKDIVRRVKKKRTLSWELT